MTTIFPSEENAGTSTSMDLAMLDENSSSSLKRRLDESIEEEPSAIKKSKLDSISGTDDLTSDAASDVGSEDDSPYEELFSAVMTANEEGRSISELFKLLPSKTDYPDYYEIIQHPIDLKMIATKIQKNQYHNLNDLEKDLLLIVKNAKKYNEPGSQIYRDAATLRKIITTKKSDMEQRRYTPLKASERIRNKRHTPAGQKWSSITAALKYEDGREEGGSMASGSIFEESIIDEEAERATNPYWQLFDTIKGYGMNAKGVAISDPFNRLPNRRAYPDYYTEIKRPISLSQIKNKIANSHYLCGQEIVDDFKLMFDNAKQYNMPDSKIYENACALFKITVDRAKELNLISHGPESIESEMSENEDSLSGFGKQPEPTKLEISAIEPPPLSPATNTRPSIDTENEESNDIPITFSNDTAPNTPVSIPINERTPSTLSKSQKKITKRLVTGYIIFASEVRKSVVQQNPECNFGDISRIIGTEWKNLAAETKAEYEKKAQRQNEESAREAAREAENNAAAPPEGVNIDNGILECRWEKCDYQFEESADLMDHLVGDPNGHVYRTYAHLMDKEENIFQCLFHGCGRVKKGAQPFPSVTRLLRHCKEVHVTKQAYKPLAFNNRTRNYVPSKTRPRPLLPPVQTPVIHAVKSSTATVVDSAPKIVSVQTSINPCMNPASALTAFDSASSTASPSSTGPMPELAPFWASPSKTGVGVQAKPVEPLFVTPPRPSRLAHSSTYIKYIEGLRAEAPHLSNWAKELNASPDNTLVPNRNRLPVQWLSNGSGNHGSIVNALWALRNFMLQDTLSLHRRSNALD